MRSYPPNVSEREYSRFLPRLFDKFEIIYKLEKIIELSNSNLFVLLNAANFT